jgi:predicted O-linked N-acetylglucosamine transferase (SPINDLY family)
MKHLGVEKSRLIILNKLTNIEYDNLYTRVDVLLDVFPYSGTTTTCDALYNSIPVVTMTHPDYHCHNVSASILKNSDLDELVTTNKTEYKNKIKELINKPELIDEYKRTIHSKFMKCMDANIFMSEYETKLEMIYSKYYNQPQQQEDTMYIEI